MALTHGQQVNYANVARESGVSASTVRNYFQILKDTLLGFEIEPWRASKKRRLVGASKFYLFDMGVANYLHPESGPITEGTDLYGRAFEHFLINEVRAFLHYHHKELSLTYWRTSSGFEVDLILGPMQIALKFKSHKMERPSDLRGLRVLKEEYPVKRAILVCRADRRRKTEDGIEICPWEQFCADLWHGKIV